MLKVSSSLWKNVLYQKCSTFLLNNCFHYDIGSLVRVKDKMKILLNLKELCAYGVIDLGNLIFVLFLCFVFLPPQSIRNIKFTSPK